MAQTASLTSEQVVEVGVAGPDDITRMFIVTGIANCQFYARDEAGGWRTSVTGTFEAMVGPTLTTTQFRRAVATASLSSIGVSGTDVTYQQWSVTDVDADFDDDEGRVQLQFDLYIQVGATTTTVDSHVSGVGFQVIILAAM